MSEAYDDFDDDDCEPMDDDDGFSGFDCGLDPESGQCALAGSEDCDWECDNRNSEWFAGSERYCRKHKQLYYTEVDVARHALGLTGDRKRSYRNYFTAGEDHADYQKWMGIVAKGLAVRIDRRGMMGGDWLFHLTYDGAEQALYEGESLDDSDFPASLRPTRPREDQV